MHIMEVSMVYTGLGVISLFFTIMTELLATHFGSITVILNRPSRTARAQGSVSGAGVTFVTRNGTE